MLLLLLLGKVAVKIELEDAPCLLSTDSLWTAIATVTLLRQWMAVMLRLG